MLKLLRGLVALGILAWLAWRLAVDFDALQHLEKDPQPLDAVGAVVAGAAGLLGLALLFPALLRVCGLGRPGHTPWYVRIWLQSYFHRYVPGKVMLVVERVRLGDQVGLQRTTSLVLILWETILLLVGACLTGAALLALAGTQDPGAPSALLLLGVAALGLVGVAAAPRILRAVLPRVPFLRDRVPEVALEASPQAWLGLSLGYASVWALLAASFVFTCRFFPAGAEAGGQEALWYVLAYVGGMVVGLTPAGLGVREGILVAGLSLQHQPEEALAFALAGRLLLTAVELPLVGLAALVRKPRSGAS